MDILKICAVLVLCAIFCVNLKVYIPQYAILLSVFCGISVLILCLTEIVPVIKVFIELTGNTAFSPYASILLKVCGVGILTKLASEMIRDAGENALASKALLAGKVSVLVLALPIIKNIIYGIKELLS